MSERTQKSRVYSKLWTETEHFIDPVKFNKISKEDLQSEEPGSNSTDHDQIVPTNTRDMFNIFTRRENLQGFNRVLHNCNVTFNVNFFQ